jgi:SnoaL-like domain
MDKSLEQRIQRLEDIEAIKKLQATYGDYVNQGWNDKTFKDISELLTENATLENKDFKLSAKGNHNVSEALKQASVYPVALHSFTNPIIDIDGDTATGNWLLWVAIQKGDDKMLNFQSEDVEYVRTDNGWLIQSIKFHLAFGIKE